MVDMTDSIGKNAGKIWSTLNTNGCLSVDGLKKKTRLTNPDFYTAIGWLARENKIYLDKDMFSIGETNLTPKIGKDAGMIWRVLDTWGKVDVTSLIRLSRIEEKDVFCAAGWLAREGKIGGQKKTTKKGKTRFWLR